LRVGNKNAACRRKEVDRHAASERNLEKLLLNFLVDRVFALELAVLFDFETVGGRAAVLG